jgi:hypothetical protein
MWWIIGILGTILFLACLRFTKVEEGTAKAIVRLGGFKKIVMVWSGYELDEGWNVKPVSEIGKKLHLPGGLRFVGFWPFDKVYTYKFRWRGIEILEAKEKVEFREKTIDYILLKPDVYWTKIEAAETVPPERIPLDVEFLVTARVLNPYKALFKAPPNWLENILSRLNALFRDWVGTKKLDDILAIRKESQKLWQELGNTDLIQKVFKEEWGILIEENGIQIRDVTLPREYAEAAAREKQMDLEARGVAAETVGSVIAMMAKARNKKPEEIQQEIDRDKNMKKEFLNLAKDLIVRKMGIDGRAYVDIRVQGAEGIERMLLNALAAWQRIPRGRGKEREGTSEEELLSPEEKRRIEEELRKKKEREKS